MTPRYSDDYDHEPPLSLPRVAGRVAGRLENASKRPRSFLSKIIETAACESDDDDYEACFRASESAPELAVRLYVEDTHMVYLELQTDDPELEQAVCEFNVARRLFRDPVATMPASAELSPMRLAALHCTVAHYANFALCAKCRGGFVKTREYDFCPACEVCATDGAVGRRRVPGLPRSDAPPDRAHAGLLQEADARRMRRSVP